VRLGRLGASQVGVTLGGPGARRFLGRARVGQQVAFGVADLAQRGVAAARGVEAALGLDLAGFPGMRQAAQAGRVFVGAGAEGGAHRLLARIGGQLGFARGQLGQDGAVGHLRYRVAGELGR